MTAGITNRTYSSFLASQKSLYKFNDIKDALAACDLPEWVKQREYFKQFPEMFMARNLDTALQEHIKKFVEERNPPTADIPQPVRSVTELHHPSQPSPASAVEVVAAPSSCTPRWAFVAAAVTVVVLAVVWSLKQ